jgi:7,8-dihydro-6-hydroxymethylpterin-pyrophosphokinase
MHRAFMGIGSSIHPTENVRKAVRLVAREVRIVNMSSVYHTGPEGRPERPLTIIA